MGVNIVPEFDAPGHSGAFMDVRPDLHLKKTVEGNAARAGEQFDLSDEHYADSSNFVKKLWDEYLTEDMLSLIHIFHGVAVLIVYQHQLQRMIKLPIQKKILRQLK